MEKYNNDILIEGFRKQDKNILKYVYLAYYPGVRNFVVKMSGREEDAKDIFQEAIIVIYRKSKDNNFVIKHSFANYLFVICKMMWYKHCENTENENEKINSFIDEYSYSIDIQQEIELNKRYKLYQYHFNKLGNDCKNILKMFL
ncbi:MAG: sigma factor, partial [Bacteroidales bacterium]|nr:sigma factor [Bacteroidales bacterium]